MKETKKEKIQGIVIIILSFIIVLGGAYFASELKYCKTETVEKELEEINMQKFYELLAGNKYSIIYLARPGCGWCQQQEPIVKSISGEYDVVFNYLNTDNLKQDDFSKIFKLSTKTFGENGSEFGTPTFLIVKGGKIVDSSIGLMQKADCIKLLQKYSLIK